MATSPGGPSPSSPSSLQGMIRTYEGSLDGVRNGAFTTQNCRTLLSALQWAADPSRGDVKVLALMGSGFFSNGIALNTIEYASSPGQETWDNICAIDDRLMAEELKTKCEAALEECLQRLQGWKMKIGAVDMAGKAWEKKAEADRLGEGEGVSGAKNQKTKKVRIWKDVALLEEGEGVKKRLDSGKQAVASRREARGKRQEGIDL
ncbi:hypothetical protein B9479_007917 [Cryptococcus floricola]|uniref:Uncharacterized protein n=1 Tax=Cryptococcus floricola TaxID=2591691 RepID=A0A5D3ANB0_9TREE|nr:hypothetical protein B9479_007917 [Cryptococcus floricola]